MLSSQSPDLISESAKLLIRLGMFSLEIFLSQSVFPLFWHPMALAIRRIFLISPSL